jgi:phytoene dehydrogenase-like protein
MDRRAFLTTLAAGWLVDASMPARAPIGGRVVGASSGAGHRLRGAALPPPAGPPERADLVVIGGGVSGLASAWRLADAGLDVVIVELEPRLGGTSAWGDDGVTPYPWGAHYLPAPDPEARAALRLLAEIGAVTGWDAAGRPRFDGRTLCHAPAERLFYRGAWWAGLAPDAALTPAERDELARFGAVERAYTERVGADGRPAFAIPLERSSRDPDVLALDRMTMADLLDREGLTTPFLRWYVRYAMLDDFGGEPDDVSAWAGMHYFASRRSRAPELEGSRFLVWPEGNGRLVRALFERARPRVIAPALAIDVASAGARVVVTYLDVARDEARRIEARAAIVAAPAFVASRLVGGAPELPRRASAPWLVANLHVSRPADPDLPWDSVLHGADGLGYVHAGHQRTSLSERAVLTYYRAFGGRDVAASRASLLDAPWDALASGVVRDLAPAHPELRDQLERIDVMVWGHAMPRPRAGFLGAAPFDPPRTLAERVAWAHVDQAGIALFEEAHAAGVHAAELLAPALGVRAGETWL